MRRSGRWRSLDLTFRATAATARRIGDLSFAACGTTATPPPPPPSICDHPHCQPAPIYSCSTVIEPIPSPQRLTATCKDATDDGIVAYSQRFGVTCAFFDPVCSSDALPAVLDDFLATARPHGRVAFWRVSSETARCLSVSVASTGGLWPRQLLHDGFDASGTQLRNLRRDLAKARDADVHVEAIDDQTSPELWRGLERVNERWLASRARSREIKRATRRTPLALHKGRCTRRP